MDAKLPLGRTVQDPLPWGPRGLAPDQRSRGRSRMMASLRSRRSQGVTLLELMLTIMIASVLVIISVSTYSSYRQRTQIQQAIVDIGTIQTAVSVFAVDNQGLPASLADLGGSVAGMLDPWGNPYQYLNHRLAPPGEYRRDKIFRPVNSDYDLYSMGKDGDTVPKLNAAPSRDDIIRGNNGNFLGLASDLDP